MGFFLDEEQPSSGDSPAPSGFFIDNGDSQSNAPRTWSETALDTGKSLMKGLYGVESFVSQAMNPTQDFGQFLTKQLTGVAPPTPSQLAEAERQQYIGDPILRNAGSGEKIALGAAEGLPWALTGGGVIPAMAMGAGGKLAVELGLPEWTGQVTGPLVTTGLGAGAKLISSLFKGGAEATVGPEQAAARYLLPYADDIKNIPPPGGGGPFGDLRTLAEETQNPQIAQLQERLTKAGAEGLGNAQLYKNHLERQQLQNSLLESLASGQVKTPEAGGNLLGNLLAKEANATHTEVAKVYNSLGSGGHVPLERLRDSVDAVIAKEYANAPIPKNLDTVLKWLNKEEFFPTTGHTAVPTGINFEKIQSFRKFANSMRQVEDARPGGANSARIIGNIIDGVDTAVTQAAEIGLLPKTDSTGFKEALSGWSKLKDTFDTGNVGKVLEKDLSGNYAVKGSNVSATLFDGTPEGTRALLKALPNDPKGLETARSAVRDHIINTYTNTDDVLRAEQFRKFLMNNEPALSAEYNGKRLFEPDHIQTMKEVSKDLGLIGGTSQTSVGKMANYASKGQPTTAQALAMMSQGGKAVKGALSNIWGLGWIVKAGDAAMANAGIQKSQLIDQVLTKAMFDKQFAKDLLLKATPTKLQNILTRASEVTSKAGSALGVGKILPNTAAVIGATTTKPGPIETNGEASSIKLPSLVSDAQAEEFTPPKKAASKKYDELKPLVDALIKVESNGKPQAVSSKGAQGLMQIMPDTGKQIAKELGVTKYNLKDPATNKKFGAYYLDKLISMFDGDLQLALTAYNQGPGRIMNLLKITGGTTLKDIRHRLGPDGRAYARKVLENFEAS